ncbi:PaaI family thioesterase [Amycolatopsis sp. K13G38]|uniref:Acyl-coenzyme A thioesterase THEM4 n=1 Tax=Amycolatopsis acididurans TaxID=2724524 RepID=A0ABX1JBE2_9PSEU|nr:PaaI family thioesterase [Amycolatopsis acididurans]NKQ56214.1 PaaI family thioesterase [Amycolatopsis acididurans]
MTTEVPGKLSPGRTTLAARVRDLIEAVVLAEDDPPGLLDAAARIEEVTESLRARRRESPRLLVQADTVGRLSANNPVEGPGNPLAPPLSRIRVDVDGMRAEVTFTAVHEGPPERVHGGWVAAVLDHAVGRAVAAAGHPAMTASLTVDYHEGTPYGVPLEVEARFARRDGRKVYAIANISSGGTITATASAILVLFTGPVPG